MRRVPPGRSMATSTMRLFLRGREGSSPGTVAGFGRLLRLVPGVGAGQTVGEARGRLPAELDAGPLVGHLPRLEVAGARFAELDAARTDEGDDRLGDLLDAHWYCALDVVGPVDGHVLERLHVGLGEILDVDKRPLLAAVPVDAQGFVAHAPLHERGDDTVVPHPRPVRDAVAQDRVGPAVEGVV